MPICYAAYLFLDFQKFSGSRQQWINHRPIVINVVFLVPECQRESQRRGSAKLITKRNKATDRFSG